MKTIKNTRNAGFSLVELMIAMTITLLMLGLVSGLFARALGTRARESRRTDALTSAQAALNVMSHEISNAGYGIYYLSGSGTQFPSNGIIASPDSTAKRIHFRANVDNSDGETKSPGEDVTYFFDDATDSIVRYDAHGAPPTIAGGAGTPLTSVVVNKISDVTFAYFNYDGTTQPPKDGTTAPSENTGRVRITVTVKLDRVQGQPDNQVVAFTSDVTLRNSNYMLYQY